jgi:membrane protein
VSSVVGEHAAVAGGRAFVGRAAELFPVRVVRRFVEHSGGSQAILIAWNALTAIFPIALAVAAVGGLVLSVAGVTPDAIARQVVALFPTDVGAQDAAIRGIEALRRQTLVFALLALVGFLWAGSTLFGSMEEAFGVVFQTPSRPFLRQKLMGLAMMGLYAVMALLAVGTSALLPLLRYIPDVPISVTKGWTAVVVQVFVGFVAGFVLFFTIYFVVPNRPQRPRYVLPAALFAGAAFELLSQLFPTYIRLNRGINMYGRQFAFLFVLLAFFYALGVITMLGADMIAVLDPPQPRSQEEPARQEAPRRGMGRLRRAAFGALALALALALGRRTRAS